MATAKLVITRPGRFVDALRRYRILVDGVRVASIASGKSAAIELDPGRHRVEARLDFLRSPPIEIEVGPSDVRHLRVGSNLARRGRLRLIIAFQALAPIAILMLAFACSRLFRDPLEGTWFLRFMAPMVFLPFLLYPALVALRRDRYLFIEEVRDLGPTLRQVDLPRELPLRVRVTIRGMMIATAILALLLGAAVEWGRYTRRDISLKRASLHAQMEAMFRRLSQDSLLSADLMVKTDPNATTDPIRRSAARAAAKADYHAAMRRKYEQAARQYRISVPPDPPAPPWP